MSAQSYLKLQSLLSAHELAFIKSIILEQINTLTSEDLKRVEDYHTLPEAVHQQILSKKYSRVFSPKRVDNLLTLPFMDRLKEHFRPLKISNVITEHGEILGSPEIYFRLVRPLKVSDVGCPHCDFWFHKMYGLSYGGIGSTWKCWVAITVEPQKSGLEFYPDLRTLSDVIYSDANGKLDCDRSQPVLGNPFLASVNPGDALIFRDDVLHSGAVNQGSFTRSSIEITFV